MNDPQLHPDWKSWPVSERVVQLAAYHCDVLKVQEEPHGSNRGFWVDQYCAVAGLVAVPWCLCFQMFLLLAAGVKPGALPVKRTRGSCAAVMAWARKNGKVVTEPERGDIGIYVNPKTGLGHAVLFLGWKGVSHGTCRTIEGNTNDDGSREGYEVCRRQREWYWPTVWVRIR